MLQQTQVSRVEEEYYPRFLKRFPTLQDLANASLDEVLSLWSGLGYYRRAKNLHKSAIEAQPSLPKTQKELLALPGIGAYTASAICSFGYEQNVPVVDTNIARVFKRFFALQNPKEKEIWSYAEKFLNHEESRHHNLALMDLGSLVCTPKEPTCKLCPLESQCQGKDNPHFYTQVKKKESIAMDLFYGICIKDNKVALQLSTSNMYKNMLVLPEVDPIEEDFLGSFKHAYTKYRLTVKLYSIEEVEGDVVWLTQEEFAQAPISSLTKKAQKFMK